MTNSLLASTKIFATTLPVLVAISVCVVFLALRVLSGTFVLTLSRRVTLLLDGLIVITVVLFFVFVVLRFKVVG